MSDIKINNAGDIDLTDGRLSLLTTEQEVTRQRLVVALKTYRGEWYLDISQGIPYFQRILRRGGNTKNVADTIFRSAINADDNVLSVNSFNSTLNAAGVYSLSFQVTTISGEIVTVQQDINT